MVIPNHLDLFTPGAAAKTLGFSPSASFLIYLPTQTDQQQVFQRHKDISSLPSAGVADVASQAAMKAQQVPAWTIWGRGRLISWWVEFTTRECAPLTRFWLSWSAEEVFLLNDKQRAPVEEPAAYVSSLYLWGITACQGHSQLLQITASGEWWKTVYNVMRERQYSLEKVFLFII